MGGLADGWWPLNEMFTLLSATAVLHLIDLGGSSASPLRLQCF
jgi:hypothetical protein